MDSLLFAEDGACVQAAEKVDVDFSPAFMTSSRDSSCSGTSTTRMTTRPPRPTTSATPDGTENPAVMYAFAADPTRPGRFATVPDNVFSIPGMVQGTCTTDDGRIVLSVSYGIAPSHLLAYNVNLAAPDGTFTTGSGDEVELFCLDSRNLTEDLVGPPMQEGIESHDGRVYTTDESASNKYIFGKLCGAGRVYARAAVEPLPNGHEAILEGDRDRRGKAALGDDGLEGVAREPVGIVLLGNVHGRHRAQVFVSQVIQGLARLVVGQMPARRCDALLDDVGIGAHLKHARIVVALQSQQVHAGKRLPGRIGHDTGVGHVAEGVATASALFEPKPVGIGRIVGSAEGTHGQAGQIEPIASVEGLERGADAGHSLAQRRGGREHRSLRTPQDAPPPSPARAGPRRAPSYGRHGRG